jgi:predicted nucleic acid-binding protein
LEHLEKFPYEEMTRETWIAAGRLGEELDRRGQRTPLGDRALAALCLERGLALYTLDAHFERIDGLRLHLPIPHSH